MSLSPVSVLAASLRALSARAAEHSSPIALSQVLAEGFAAIAATLEEAELVVGSAIADAFECLPLTDADREALRQAGLGHLVADQVAAGTDAHLVDTAGPQVVSVTASVSEPELAAVASAPRVTLADVQANIVDECYFTADQARAGAAYMIHDANDRGPLSVLTFCVLTLRNGFTVTGESACASPENFDPAIGERLARENAVRKIWPLMGYELRSKLAGA